MCKFKLKQLFFERLIKKLLDNKTVFLCLCCAHLFYSLDNKRGTDIRHPFFVLQLIILRKQFHCIAAACVFEFGYDQF